MKKLMSALVMVFTTCLNSSAREPAGIPDKAQDRKIGYISTSEYLEKQPSFGIYHDIYFITGIPTNKYTNSKTADAKFQVSFRQILHKNYLPKNIFIALTYTQKSFWDVYKASQPFADNNYNPGVTAFMPISRHGELRGILSFGIEHESNGLNTTLSRSWNYLVLSCSYYVRPNLSLEVKFWPGIASTENAKIYKYRGWGMAAVNFNSVSERIILSGSITPRKGGANSIIEASFKIFNVSNQFLFIQWQQGYGESMMAYKEYKSMVRMGICIKPQSKKFFLIY